MLDSAAISQDEGYFVVDWYTKAMQQACRGHGIAGASIHQGFHALIAPALGVAYFDGVAKSAHDRS
jgi:hypothetical protein